jgi:chromatin remodeling complex protein RSC6
MSSQTKPRAPRASKKKNEEVVVEVKEPEVVQTPVVVVETPVPAPPTPPPVQEVVPELPPTPPSEVEVVENVPEEPSDPVEKLQKQFEDLRTLLAAELETLGSEKPLKKNKMVTLLRKVNRHANQLEKQAFRLVKTKKSVHKNKVISGFQKPTRISKELAKFTGWNDSDLHSRVEVTKFICDYIKTNNLQNPEDRRQIVPDAKLQKLLGYNPKKETEPLRYYSIQFHLNKMKHFPKVETVVPTQA